MAHEIMHLHGNATDGRRVASYDVFVDTATLLAAASTFGCPSLKTSQNPRAGIVVASNGHGVPEVNAFGAPLL